MNALVTKTTTLGFDAGLNGVLSSMREDSYGDVVGDPTEPRTLGWDVKDFLRNPIALWSHDTRAPIGRWEDVHVENNELRGRLHLAPSGSSVLVDEMRALVSARVLKAISVGFRPTKSQPRANGGVHYLRQVLCEASLVSVPANQSALLEARALGVSDQTIQKVFLPMKPPGIGAQIRQCRGRIAKAKMILERSTTSYQRSVNSRVLAIFQREERELLAAWRGGSHSNTQTREQRERAEIDRALQQAAADMRDDPWDVKWHQQKTIDNFTKAQARIAPKDPKPFTASSDRQATWRNQKIDTRPTWRGRKV